MNNFYINKSDYFVIKHLRFILFLVLINSTTISYGQYNFSLGANYIYAFGKKRIEFQNATYKLNATQGYEITANNSYHFPNTKIHAVLELGFRQLYFSGSSSDLVYSGQLNKMIAAAGGGYSFSEKMKVTAYVEAENNLGFDEFYAGTGDLFRISLSLESTYFITKGFGVTILLSRAMTPITEAYIIPNPQYQVRAGLIYQFIK